MAIHFGNDLGHVLSTCRRHHVCLKSQLQSCERVANSTTYELPSLRSVLKKIAGQFSTTFEVTLGSAQIIGTAIGLLSSYVTKRNPHITTSGSVKRVNGHDSNKYFDSPMNAQLRSQTTLYSEQEDILLRIVRRSVPQRPDLHQFTRNTARDLRQELQHSNKAEKYHSALLRVLDALSATGNISLAHWESPVFADSVNLNHYSKSSTGSAIEKPPKEDGRLSSDIAMLAAAKNDPTALQLVVHQAANCAMYPRRMSRAFIASILLETSKSGRIALYKKDSVAPTKSLDIASTAGAEDFVQCVVALLSTMSQHSVLEQRSQQAQQAPPKFISEKIWIPSAENPRNNRDRNADFIQNLPTAPEPAFGLLVYGQLAHQSQEISQVHISGLEWLNSFPLLERLHTGRESIPLRTPTIGKPLMEIPSPRLLGTALRDALIGSLHLAPPQAVSYLDCLGMRNIYRLKYVHRNISPETVLWLEVPKKGVIITKYFFR